MHALGWVWFIHALLVTSFVSPAWSEWSGWSASSCNDFLVDLHCLVQIVVAGRKEEGGGSKSKVHTPQKVRILMVISYDDRYPIHNRYVNDSLVTQ